MLALLLGRQPLELSRCSQPDNTQQDNPADPVFGCKSNLWLLVHELVDVTSWIQAGGDVNDKARILKFRLNHDQ
jgi:sulfur transfer protein SufE